MHTQLRREVSITAGRIIVRGKLGARGQQKRADYILFYKRNLPLATIEAKDSSDPVGAGMQQGLEHAETLDVPFVFTSNGDGFVLHDRTGLQPERETELAVGAFPSPETLSSRYKQWRRAPAPTSPCGGPCRQTRGGRGSRGPGLGWRAETG